MGQEEHPDSPAPHAPHTPAPVGHLVVSHADVGPDVVIGDDLLLALRLGKANRGRDVGGRSGGLPGQQQGQPLWLCHPLPPCPLLPGAPAGSEPPVSRWPPGRSGRRQHSAPARGGEGSGLGGGWQPSLGAGGNVPWGLAWPQLTAIRADGSSPSRCVPVTRESHLVSIFPLGICF